MNVTAEVVGRGVVTQREAAAIDQIDKTSPILASRLLLVSVLYMYTQIYPLKLHRQGILVQRPNARHKGTIPTFISRSSKEFQVYSLLVFSYFHHHADSM